MTNTKTKIGYALALLLPAGVIATILAVLMTDGNQSSTKKAEVALPQGDYIYAEIKQLGSIRGKISKPEGTIMFRGVPFGESTAGQNRWRRPMTVNSLRYNGMFYDASYHRPSCPQNCTLPSPQYVCPDQMSEDCLHLAVYVPSRLARKVESSEGYYYEFEGNLQNINMPVMVFFYGGAFIAGGSGLPLYDGRYISENGDVIVVIPNYRLGPFGFFYQDTRNADAALGNLGIWDQIEALKWVKNHIRHFGGNPDEVTIFGQSAGAQSVAVHLVNDISGPLFHRAVMESNPFGINYKTKIEAQKMCAQFAESAGCSENDMNCLRGLSTEELISTLNGFSLLYQFNPNSITQLFEPWAPMIDDNLLFQHPYFSFLKETNQDKPIIFGTAKDEGMFFILQIFPDKVSSPQIYTFMFELVFGNATTEVESQYPGSCTGFNRPVDCDNRFAMDDWVTDFLFTCQSRHVFSTANRLGNENANIWWYLFNQTWSFPEFWEEYDACYDLSCHSAELPYLFDMSDIINDPNIQFTPEEVELSNRMIRYWSNFAKYGNPNGKDQTNGASWPRMYEGGSTKPKTFELTGFGDRILEDFNKDNCDMFDTLDMYLNDSVKIGPRNYPEIVNTIHNLQKNYE